MPELTLTRVGIRDRADEREHSAEQNERDIDEVLLVVLTASDLRPERGVLGCNWSEGGLAQLVLSWPQYASTKGDRTILCFRTQISQQATYTYANGRPTTMTS
jgi:hypothetical protein